ncbi:aminotransferase class V-fold PLP-dependent enzyme [Patescibacteria group bacterium]|nr:aminotransferase class V-fold PLP-dependent enzyme [Patescibacteria group bacterium]
MLNTDSIKRNFPILTRVINGKKLVYLDNAATSQKPFSVVEAISSYYLNNNANVHRGVHTLSDESTTIFENSKNKIAKFFGAKNHELIFVRNTTEAINGVAYGWGEKNIDAGDVILVSILDHHSNIVVWQELCKRKKANLIFIGITDDGKLDLDDFDSKLKKFFGKIKLVAFPHVSNALGSTIDLKVITKKVRATEKAEGNKISGVVSNRSSNGTTSVYSIKILIDGAQSAPHMKINFDDLDIDFFTFSGHKMLGPMGVGGLLVREELLKTDQMQPWLFGGGMISEVHESHTNFHDDLSERFIAGTPDVASVAGLAAACKYLENLGMENVLQHDKELVAYALDELSKNKDIEIVGPKANSKNNTRIGSVSFIYKGVHAHDVAQVLDSEGIAVRSGHHCTMPLHTSQNWVATTRVSFQVYNSKEDIDTLVEGLKKVKKVFK